MRKYTLVLVSILLVGIYSRHASAQYSGLGNIYCGNGIATCTDGDSGTVGDAGCFCTATCLPASCPVHAVAAGQTVAWPASKVTACPYVLKATATGGPYAPLANENFQSALYATATLSGGPINGTLTATTIDDCFQGYIRQDEMISPPC